MLLSDLLKEYLFDCQIRNLTKKTIKGYKNHLEFFFNYLQVEHKILNAEDITQCQIKLFFNYQSKKGRKASYINGHFKVFRAFFAYIINEKYIVNNPLERIKWLKEPKTIIQSFSSIEVKKMIEVFNGNDYISIRNRIIVCILFDTGIRCNELCLLKTVSIKDDYIIINGKGNKERIVGKSPFILKLLFKYERAKNYYFEYKNIPYDNVFLSRTGRPLTVEAIERIVREAGKMSNVSSDIRCSPHTCRHTFAQMQLKNGIDVYSLSRILGHENIKITQRYLQGLQDNDIVAKSIKTSPLMNLI